MAINLKNIYKGGLTLVFILVFFAYHFSNIKSYIERNNITYRIQILASLNNRIPTDSIASIYKLSEKIYEDSLNGWYKYSVGNFKSYQEAINYRNILNEKNTTKGAFVVIFKSPDYLQNNTTYPKIKAKKKNFQKINYNLPIVSNNPKYIFKIQIGASHISISIDSLKNRFNIGENVDEEKVGEWYKYTVGKYKNYSDAKLDCDKLTSTYGISGAFIVAYLNNQRTIYTAIKPKPIQYIKHPIVYPKRTYVQTPVRVVPKKNKQKNVVKITAKQATTEPVIKKDLVIYHINSTDLKNITKKIIIQNEPNKTNNQPPVDITTYNYRRGNYTKPGNVVNIITADTLKLKVNKKLNTKYESTFTKIKNNAFQTLFGAIVLILIFYLIFNFIVVTVIVFISRIRKNRKEIKIKKLENEIQNLLAEYLFDPDSEVSALNKLKNISSTFKRGILIDEIMKLSVDMSGETLDAIRHLYFTMTLDKDSLKKLNDRRWHIRVKGCRELTRMKAFKAKDEIEKMLNSKNEIIRMEAQIAMIELNEENPYYFLEKLSKPFLSWEQLNVHVLIQRNGYEVPDFNKWLKSPNETIVLFAIEMIRIYKQISNAPRLINFFEHPNLKLREAAIKAVGEVGYVDCLPDLRRIYNYSDDEFKTIILKSMIQIPDDNNKDFLKNILESKADKRFKLEAAKAMSSLGVRGQVELKKFTQSSDEELVSIVNHVFDNRI